MSPIAYDEPSKEFSKWFEAPRTQRTWEDRISDLLSNFKVIQKRSGRIWLTAGEWLRAPLSARGQWRNREQKRHIYSDGLIAGYSMGILTGRPQCGFLGVEGLENRSDAVLFCSLSNTKLSWYRVEEGQDLIRPGQQSSCRVGVQTWKLEGSGYKEFISTVATALGFTAGKSHPPVNGWQPFCHDHPPLGSSTHRRWRKGRL